MPYHFKTLDELNKGEAESVLLYGGAGTGKTFFCATGGERTLIINIGHGIETIQAPYFRSKFPEAAKIKIITLENTYDDKGNLNMVKLFDDVGDALVEALETYPELFDTVVIDDASTLRRAAMNKAIEVNFADKLSTTKTKVEKWDVLTPAMQDYQREMSIIEQMLADITVRCKAASKHLIVTAHERYTWKPGDKMGAPAVLVKISPSFTGVDKNPDQITQYFGSVWRTEAVSGGNSRIYRITTQGSETVAAKTRWNGVFDSMEQNLTWAQALKRIQESDPKKKLLGVKL